MTNILLITHWWNNIKPSIEKGREGRGGKEVGVCVYVYARGGWGGGGAAHCLHLV